MRQEGGGMVEGEESASSWGWSSEVESETIAVESSGLLVGAAIPFRAEAAGHTFLFRATVGSSNIRRGPRL